MYRVRKSAGHDLMGELYILEGPPNLDRDDL